MKITLGELQILNKILEAGFDDNYPPDNERKIIEFFRNTQQAYESLVAMGQEPLLEFVFDAKPPKPAPLNAY